MNEVDEEKMGKSTSVERALELNENKAYNPYIGELHTSDEEGDNQQENNLPIEKNWYVINTFGGQERRVKEDLEKRVKAFHLENEIDRIIVAEQEEPVLDENGKQKMTKDKITGQKTPKYKIKNIYPGYIFVEMVMTDEAWFVVRNTPGVSGITGSSGKGAKPFPISKEEIEPVFKRIGIEDPNMYSAYKVSDHIKIVAGQFEGTDGNITAIDSERSIVTVNITFFGRTSEIQAKFSEIEKYEE